MTTPPSQPPPDTTTEPSPPRSAETYGLFWPGKRHARALAESPPTASLVPQPNPDEPPPPTANLFIEGDNLDALKLLRPELAGAVDLIYIDPPYNTGNDFVFDDNFSRQHHAPPPTTSPGNAPAAANNSSPSARRHANWLSMMYPRLLAARDLLAPTGVGFISLDRREVHRCALLLEEVFGEDNLLPDLVWVSNLKGRQIGAAGPATTHEHILCFARDASKVGRFRTSATALRSLMPDIYKSRGYEIKHDQRGPYVTKNRLHNTNSRFNERTAPTMVFFIHHNFETGQTRVTDIDDDRTFPGFVRIEPHPNARPGLRYHAWRWSRKRVIEAADELEFTLDDGTARVCTKIRDVDGMTLKDIILGIATTDGHADLRALGLERTFDNPKPLTLLKTLINAAAPADALVLDFFAGSAATAHAVMQLNAEDHGTRRFVMVQRPDPLDPTVRPQRAAAEWCDRSGFPRKLTEPAKERLRRAAEQIRRDHPGTPADLGFRVLTIEPLPSGQPQAT